MTTKKKTAAQQAVRDVIEGDTVTLVGITTRGGGEQVREPVTFKIPALKDLPRSIRRKVRQAQVKYAAPAQGDRSGGRFDLFSLAFEVGEMIALHHGVRLDLDDDSLPADEADAQDAVVTSLGMRVLSSQIQGEGEGDNPNDETPEGEGDDR